MKLFVSGGRGHGLEPADLVGAIVDQTRLDNEQVQHVRVLERFSFVELPAERVDEVLEKVSGQSVKGVKLRLEVAKR